MTRIEPKLTRIQSQRIVSPESDFLKDHDIQEVFENELTVEFIQNNCFSSNTDAVDDYADGMQKSELDLWSNSPNENLVYGLKENSMKLFQDTGEAINASYIGPDESKFCYMEVKLEPTGEVEDDHGPAWFVAGKKILVNYTIPTRSFSEVRITFVLITSKSMDSMVNLIGYKNCAQSNTFLAKVNPDKGGIGIEIAESHILPFTVKQEDSMQMLHGNFDEDMNAGRLYDQNPKKNTKFSYSCAEIFYEGYHKAQDKNGKLDECKRYYIIGTNLMQGMNYGPIMICMDKTKTLRDVKRKIVECLKQNHGVSISEDNFELYRINTRPINPEKHLEDVGNVMILKMKSA